MNGIRAKKPGIDEMRARFYDAIFPSFKDEIMHYWNSILNDVLQKDHEERVSLFAQSDDFIDAMENTVSHRTFVKVKETRDLRTYYLGEKYPDIYLTKREAECMFWVVQDCTINQAASKMGLSARTVEFYVKNMKLKLCCASKKQLIHKILQTNLLQQLEKEGMRLAKH